MVVYPARGMKRGEGMSTYLLITCTEHGREGTWTGNSSLFMFGVNSNLENIEATIFDFLGDKQIVFSYSSQKKQKAPLSIDFKQD